MNKQKTFVMVASVINFLLLLFALFILLNDLMWGLLIVLFPIIIGLITFFVSFKRKKYELLRAVKYASLAYFVSYFIPLGIFFVLLYYAVSAIQPIAVPEYGVAIDPILEQCMTSCRDLGNYTSQKVQECIDKCWNR